LEGDHKMLYISDLGFISTKTECNMKDAEESITKTNKHYHDSDSMASIIIPVARNAGAMEPMG
jgi:hypothetical protein